MRFYLVLLWKNSGIQFKVKAMPRIIIQTIAAYLDYIGPTKVDLKSFRSHEISRGGFQEFTSTVNPYFHFVFMSIQFRRMDVDK